MSEARRAEVMEAGCRRARSVAAMATILHSADVPAGALVGARQPLEKKSGGFIRRRSVKRHQSRGHARYPDDIGAPAVDGDRRYLDEVRLAGNGFLKTMDDAIHRQRFFQVWRERDGIYGSVTR